MLDLDTFRTVLASAELRAQHGLELPPASLDALTRDPSQVAALYERWTAAGQPRYGDPVASEPSPPPPAPAPAAPLPAVPLPAAPLPAPATTPLTASPAPPTEHGITWTPAFKRVDIEDDQAGFAFGNGQQRSTPSELFADMPAEQQEQFRQAITAVEQVPVVKLVMTPGFWAVIGGVGAVLVGLLFVLILFAAHAPLYFFLAPAAFVAFGLAGGIRGLRRMSR